jgi:tight adherence protein C
MTSDIMFWAVSALLFAAVVLLVMAAAPMFARRLDLASRLSGPSPTPSKGSETNLRTDQTASMWAKLIAEIESRGLSLNDTRGDVLAEKLMLAGYDQTWAPRAFVLIRTMLTILLPLVTMLVIWLTGMTPTLLKLYMILGGAAVMGLYLPNFIINSRAESRRVEILNGFPDTLDLMLVCVEAGLGIDAAFSRVGVEIVGSHPLLAHLFANVALELRAGKSREMALRTLARRTAIPEISAFTTLIIQSDKLGASIAMALKVYAGEMREARRMRAEEKAHRIPVLLSIPLVVFLLPCMISVLALPPIINMRNVMATNPGPDSPSGPKQ